MAEILNESELQNVSGGFDGPCFVHMGAPGETLEDVARNYDVPVETLCSLNCISNPKASIRGQKIFVPVMNLF